MSDVLRTSPQLRLVGQQPATDDVLRRDAEERRAEIGVQSENRAASTNPELEAADPRWVLASRAYSQLDGAALSPERRERVLRTASTLGIRPFDANLIIAIVQDRARRGRPLGSAAGTLSLVQNPNADHGESGRIATGSAAWWQLVLTLAAGLTGTALLIRWLLGA